jgi:beta-glucanase (GH16 family)
MSVIQELQIEKEFGMIIITTGRNFITALLACSSAAIVLSACGGGGGGDPGTAAMTTLVVAPETAQPEASSQTPAPAETVAAAAEAAAAAPAAAAESVPFGQSDASAYTLTFNEEFDSFNTKMWNDHVWYESANETKNFTVEDGKLKIWPQRDASGKFFNRTIDTDGTYYQTYGYFEVEAKLPKGKGTWPAFWLFNHVGDRRPEMDVMEAYAGGNGWGTIDANGVARPTVYAATVWKGDYDGQQVGMKMYDAGADLSEGFHKYAVKWEPNKQTYYFDGKEILVLNTTMSDPMYLMLDLWFGSASGTADDSTPQGKSNSYEVNYVRAWQFK